MKINKPEKKKVLWVVLGEEELPLGVVVAKTPGGAEARYEKTTGRSRDNIHVERVNFNKHGFCSFAGCIKEAT